MPGLPGSRTTTDQLLTVVSNHQSLHASNFIELCNIAIFIMYLIFTSKESSSEPKNCKVQFEKFDSFKDWWLFTSDCLTDLYT